MFWKPKEPVYIPIQQPKIEDEPIPIWDERNEARRRYHGDCLDCMDRDYDKRIKNVYRSITKSGWTKGQSKTIHAVAYLMVELAEVRNRLRKLEEPDK